MVYQASAQDSASPTGDDPINAPPCMRKLTCAAVSVPSAFIPSLTSIDAEAVGPVARSTSARLITSLTGRPPALRDSAKASGSMKIVVLPPNPPPISEGVTRNCEASVPSTAEHIRRIYHWPWVQTHISPLPSAPIWPRQAWGSI